MERPISRVVQIRVTEEDLESGMKFKCEFEGEVVDRMVDLGHHAA